MHSISLAKNLVFLGAMYPTLASGSFFFFFFFYQILEAWVFAIVNQQVSQFTQEEHNRGLWQLLIDSRDPARRANTAHPVFIHVYLVNHVVDPPPLLVLRSCGRRWSLPKPWPFNSSFFGQAPCGASGDPTCAALCFLPLSSALLRCLFLPHQGQPLRDLSSPVPLFSFVQEPKSSPESCFATALSFVIALSFITAD